MPINQADIEKVAQLAHLELAEEELKTLGAQIAEIVSYVEQLNEIDTSNVESARRRDRRLTRTKGRARRSTGSGVRALPRAEGAVIELHKDLQDERRYTGFLSCSS